MIQGTLPPSACLEPEVLGVLAEGGLAGAERAAAVRHLASCRRCHEVFASSLQILEDEGALPLLADPASAVVPRRRTLAVWFSAAAAALVSAVLFVQRAPVVVPRIAEVPPTPVATPTAAPSATPSPAAVQAASLPPEAVLALRTLNGYESRYRGGEAVGFAPNPRGRAVAQGIADIDAAAAQLGHGRTPTASVASEPADDWRRVGRILEASRLALLDQAGKPESFFATPWASDELARASRLLVKAGVPDAEWPDDLRRHSGPIDGDAAQKLLDRLDALLEHLR
jgi:hypothetical protein